MAALQLEICSKNVGKYEKGVIQTYDGPLRQSTPVIPSGNSSKTKSNCILSCLLAFQCNLKSIMKSQGDHYIAVWWQDYIKWSKMFEKAEPVQP